MKKILYRFFILIVCVECSFSQTLTLDDIYYSGKYSPNSGFDLYFSELDDYYLQLEENDTYYTLVRTNIKENGGRRVEVYKFNKSVHENVTPAFSLSQNERYMLAYSEQEKIYRYSTKAYCFVIDIEQDILIPVAEGKKIMYPDFSPDSRYVSYVYENNLYYFDIQSGETVQVTNDGKKNEIVNGMGDWVYEEELSVTKGYFWSDDSQRLAYYKFDDSEVENFHYVYYPEHESYPVLKTIRYPKVDATLPKVMVHVYNLIDKNDHKVDIQAPCCDYYIPIIKWMPFSENLFLVQSNRLQTSMKYYLYNTDSERLKLLTTVSSSKYQTVRRKNFMFLSKSRSLLYIAPDKNNYSQIFRIRIGKDKNTLYQVTNGNYDITELCGVNQNVGMVFFRSTENGALHRAFSGIRYKTNFKVDNHTTVGFYQAKFRKDGKYYLLKNSSTDSVPKTKLYKYSGKFIKDIEHNEKLENKLSQLKLSPVEFLKVKTRNGHGFNAYVVKPNDFDPTKKYPLMVYVYGGPGSQQVHKGWMGEKRLIAQYFANQGYVYACMDGTGTGYRGKNFEHKLYRKLGTYEPEDQIDFASFLSEKPWIDKERMGIWGWSYGGYVSSLCMMAEDNVFKSGVAVAPVTDWRYYDATYTERYMGKYSTNTQGYKIGSVIERADNLKNDYLLVHGLADDNVHFQHSVMLSKKLIELNKPFEQAYYPNHNHAIKKDKARIHIMNKINYFFNKTLK